MTANEYQLAVKRILDATHPSLQTKMEWSVSERGLDNFSNKEIYAPRLDLALGPFNDSPENSEERRSEIFQNARISLIRKLVRVYSERTGIDVDTVNTNPRCLLAIEVSFSGSSKHLLGDIANASIMGLYGIVIGKDQNHNSVLLERIKNYVQLASDLGKTGDEMFKNVLVFSESEFLELISPGQN